MQSPLTEYDSSVVIRAAHGTYVAFGSVLGIVLLLSIATALTTQMGWVPVLLPLGAMLFAFIWIHHFRIEISKTEIRYRTLFSGNQSIRVSEIQTYKMGTNFRAPLGPPLRLTIYPRRGTDTKPIVINVKVFSREGVKELREFLDKTSNTRNAAAEKELPQLFR